jgi:glucosamine--fructose-6-phosphate aminotransferase (isomerizing)
MNSTNPEYKKFGLCADMMKTVDVIRDFDKNEVLTFAREIEGKNTLFLTGEGSSRIFPAKNAISRAMQANTGLNIKTDAALQAMEYHLEDSVIVGVSNSGKTSELIQLFLRLKSQNHPALFGVTANHNTPLEELCHRTHILKCGREQSVAATISVIEQALFFDVLLSFLSGIPMPSFHELSENFRHALSLEIPVRIIDKIMNAGVIYFAGRNNGVAEELTLKTNEIIRKRSDFLEGTYAVHGVEEVMRQNDVLILIDPYPGEEEKFRKYLAEGVGLEIIAIAGRQTLFPTLLLPGAGYFSPYLQMAAGWNLLAECGLKIGIDLDKPQRARKIGNEFTTKTLNP